MVASRESTPAKEPAYLNGFVDGSDLVLLYRDERGQMLARRRRAEWSSFYRREQVSADVMRDLRNSSFVVGVSEEKDRVRVRWQAPEWRRKAHEEGGWAETAGLTAFEADVSEVARYFQETGAEVAKPRRVYLDIETDSRVPPAVVRQGKARVLCWSLVDEDVRVVAQGLLREDTDEDERRVLEEFWRAIDPYDQVVAWYGDGFDFPIVKLRSQTTGANVKDPRRWLWLDFMPVYERMNRNAANSGAEKESMRLQDVAMSRLGEGKTPFDASKTWEEWAAGGERRQRLVDYCAQDTKLLPKLERKAGFLDVNDAICQVSRQFADTQSANPTSYVDGFLLRMGHEQGLRFPSRARYGQEEQKKHEQFAGAFVMEPKCHGIERDIHVVDFSGMYPSIILTWNMSPETKRAIAVNGPIPAGHCRSPSTRVGFSTEHAGILCEAVKKIRAMRKHYQKLQASLPPGTPEWTDAGRLSTAYKVIANAFYGVVGSPFSRFFDRQIAESVSQNGVWLAQKTRYEAETRGMEVVYMDTDSLFVRGTTREAIAAFVEWCNAELYPKLVAECGCVDNHVEIAYEKEFERLVFVSAKKYCNPPEAPIWMADGTFKPIGEVRPGDHVMGWVRGEDGKRTSLVESVVVGTQRRRAPIVRVRLESGKTIRCTEDHRWLRSRELRSRRGSLHYSYPWCTPKKGREIVSVVEQPRKLSHAEEVEASWLGGIWDGEGSLCSDNRGQIVFAQSPRKNPEVCARIESALRLLGFDFGVHGGSGGVNVYAIRGGLQERVNFLAWCKPAKGHRLARSFFRSRFRTPDKIVAVEPDEKDGEVVALQTTTGNYVAWGYASKNCATYRHYKWTASCACDTKGEPGALDVRTMTCKDCGKTWGALPPPRGEPEIRGLEYKRGDVIRIARKLQWDVVQKLMRGLSEDPTDFVPMVEAARDHVLNDALPVEDVRLSKSLSKSLREYKPKAKADGTAAAEPPHVQVARELKRRGELVGEGAKIFYYVTDASESPMKVAPAADYANDPDRFYLWENLIYPATQRLLEAAFPPEKGMSAEVLQLRDWRRFERVRPKMERGRAALSQERESTPAPPRKGRGRAAPEGQGGLFAPPAPVPPPPAAAPAPAPAGRPGEPFLVELAARGRQSMPELEGVKAALLRHPGDRAVVLRIVLAEGTVDLDVPMRVALSPDLVRDVERAKGAA